ncbi:lipopolysaccharide biosynthesis protein [Posidoniimonas polymericola]|uniref:lipopolysaccharide biosynthesis protein n=1 Tax=Posidoniimonas polymericola TaxID=2528002 RepID=UPI0018D39CB6|nr:polysaccharide biosynthesis C-terminal domain-containing protein [Posidoniimonas polymericola]
MPSVTLAITWTLQQTGVVAINAPTALLAQLTGLGAMAVCARVVAARSFAATRRELDASTSALEWEAEARPLALLSAATVLQMQGSLLLVAWALSPQSTSVFGIATKIASVLFIGVEIAGLITQPRYAAAADRATLQRHASRAAWAASILAVLMGIALLAGRPLLVSVLGIDYRDITPTLSLLSVLYLASVATGSPDLLLNMSGYPWVCVQAMAASAVAGLVATLCLAPAFGPMGAAAGHAGGLLFRQLLLAWRVKRLTGINTTVFTYLNRPTPDMASSHRLIGTDPSRNAA